MARSQALQGQAKQTQKTSLRKSNPETKSSYKHPPRLSTTSPHILAPQITGCTANPITPPQRAGVPGLYKCIVDYNHQPYSITWSGSQEYPGLERFPYLENVEVSSVPQNPIVAAIWRDSELLDYGSYASIRITENDLFPILKLAHYDELSIQLIQHEFDMLSDLKRKGLSIVDFQSQPVLDSGVVCGYRMKKLFKIELHEFRSRIGDIKYELDRFHSAGFSHGDFSPSNTMKDESGRIVLTDVSFAGPLGSAVPSFFPRWRYSNSIYSIDSDKEQFDRFAISCPAPQSSSSI